MLFVQFQLFHEKAVVIIYSQLLWSSLRKCSENWNLPQMPGTGPEESSLCFHPIQNKDVKLD